MCVSPSIWNVKFICFIEQNAFVLNLSWNLMLPLNAHKGFNNIIAYIAELNKCVSGVTFINPVHRLLRCHGKRYWQTANVEVDYFFSQKSCIQFSTEKKNFPVIGTASDKRCWRTSQIVKSVMRTFVDEPCHCGLISIYVIWPEQWCYNFWNMLACLGKKPVWTKC